MGHLKTEKIKMNSSQKDKKYVKEMNHLDSELTKHYVKEKKTIDNSIILRGIKDFQESPFGHPLTCREGCTSPRPKLIGTEIEGRVVLLCPNCSYVQELLEGEFEE